MKILLSLCLVFIAALAVSARPFSRGVECPPPPPSAAGDLYQAVSTPRDQINQLTASLHSSGRFIAMAPDDLQAGCYIITYWQNF